MLNGWVSGLGEEFTGSPSVLFEFFLDPNIPILDRRPNLDMNLSEWNNFFLEISFDVWFCKERMEMER